MPTLFDISQRVARELGITVRGIATDGSTTELTDTTLLDNYPDDYFVEGTVWVLYDAGGAGAAPQGEWGIVKKYGPEDFTLTFHSALTAQIASGDHYLLAHNAFSLYDINDAINRTLDEIGKTEYFDTSTTGAAAQTEYTLPAADIDVKRVYVQGTTTDSNDNRWKEVNGWSIQKTASGSADTLIMPYNPPSGYAIGIEYVGVHPQVYASTSTIDERVHIPQLVKRAAMLCIERKMFDGSSDPNIENQLELLRRGYEEMRAETMPPRRRRVRYFSKYLQRNVSRPYTVNHE